MLTPRCTCCESRASAVGALTASSADAASAAAASALQRLYKETALECGVSSSSTWALPPRLCFGEIPHSQDMPFSQTSSTDLNFAHFVASSQQLCRVCVCCAYVAEIYEHRRNNCRLVFQDPYLFEPCDCFLNLSFESFCKRNP